MSQTRKIVLNTFSLLLSGMSVQVINFFLIAYISRILEPELFGKLNYVLAIMAYLLIIGNSGASFFGTAEIAKRKWPMQSIVNNYISLRFAVSAVLMGGIFIFSFFIDPLSQKLFWIYGIEMVVYAFYLDWVFQGLEKMKYIGIARFGSAVLYALLSLMFVHRPEDVVLLPYFQLSGTVLAGGFLYYLLRIQEGYCLRWESTKIAYITKESYSTTLFMVMNLVMFNISIVLLSHLRSDYEVGIYSAYYKLIMVIVTFIGVYYNAIYPVVAGHYGRGDTKAILLLKTISAKISISMSFLFIGTFMVFSKEIIGILFGNKYIEYSDALVFQSILIFFVFLNSVYGRGMMACGQQKILTKIIVFLATLNVILGFILIPLYGIYGAVWTNVAVEAIALPLQYFYFSKVVHVNFVPLLLKPIGALIAFFGMIKMCLIFTETIFLVLITSAFVYVLALLFTGYFEVNMLKKTFAK